MNGDGRTVLALLIPAAEPHVARWRDRYDPVARAGMPAHVTIVYPWLPALMITGSDRAALAEVAADAAPLELTFPRFGRFPRTLWLEPRPAESIIDLVGAVVDRFPDYLPYGGRFPDLVPHLTVADGVDPQKLQHVVDEVEPKLPVLAHVDRLTLLRYEDGRWLVDAEFPFGGRLALGG